MTSFPFGLRVRAARCRVALLAAAAMAATAPAWAHTQLKSSLPAANQQVQAAPAEVVLQFSDKLQLKLSDLAVRDASGRKVDKGDVRLAGDDPTRLAVTLDQLPAGAYEVSWSATCVYSHKLSGRFSFNVRP